MVAGVSGMNGYSFTEVEGVLTKAARGSGAGVAHAVRFAKAAALALASEEGANIHCPTNRLKRLKAKSQCIWTFSPNLSGRRAFSSQMRIWQSGRHWPPKPMFQKQSNRALVVRVLD